MLECSLVFVEDDVTTVDVEDVRTDRSQLLDPVVSGDEIVIARADASVARLVTIVTQPRCRFGLLEGQMTMTPDFDGPRPADVLAGFEGR